MPINKNHEFEDLDGVKCAIVEKNASPERVQFLQDLLEFNHYTVVVVPSAPPKAAPAPKPAEGTTPEPEPPVLPPTSFTLGVTDVTFNPTNAVFGRLLKTRNGHTVTLAYWQQKETIPSDEIPYFQNKH